MMMTYLQFVNPKHYNTFGNRTGYEKCTCI